MNKVRSSSQMKVKTSGQATRPSTPNVNSIRRGEKEDPKLKGKSSGKGLDDYNLDIMTLE